MSSRTEDELYKYSKFSGWTDYTTMRGIDTNEKFINDAAAILHHLENSGKLKKFLDTLNKYIEHTNADEKTAHGLTLEQVANIVQNLHTQYRKLGYTGSIDDMLHALFTKIDVVSYAEAIAGTDDTKAVSAKKFPYQFIIHDRSPKSHKGTLVSFIPENVVKTPPSISYINLYEEAYRKYIDPDTQLHIFPLYMYQEKWNQFYGTIYITVNCDLSTSEIPIYTLQTNSSTSFICYYKNNKIGVKRYNTFTHAYNRIGEVDLHLINPSKRRFIFAYSPKSVLLASIINPNIQVTGSFKIDATRLYFHLPFYTDDTPELPSIVRWVYYPEYICDDAQLVSLLS
jgi:hypothetical protein